MKAPAYLPLFPYLPARRDACLLAPGELVIDNFAGIGGASTGMEAALGRPVDHAINHDPVAVSLHRVNHPHSHHSVEDVWEVDPREITKGQSVALAWFSPDCRHHSKAKGGKPVNKKIRGLAWVALRWAHLVRPRVIIVENVEEMCGWGRLTPAGKVDPRYKGETFKAFTNAFRHQGYAVEWRELRACDYGAPTIRKRLFIVARRDGLPIIWPEPTHAAPDDPLVEAGLLRPYRTAAECLDWHLPTRSVFGRKKELAFNTRRRIAAGVQRFVLEAGEPFLVSCNHEGERFRGQGLDEPKKTICGKDSDALVTAHLMQDVAGRTKPRDANWSVDRPTRVIAAQGCRHNVVLAHLTAYYSKKRRPDQPERKPDPGQAVDRPLRTVRTKDCLGLVTTECATELTPEQLVRAQEVHAFLREHLGAALDPYSEGGLVVLQLAGARYILADISMRILTSRELARAQGFDDRYVLDRTAEGEYVTVQAQKKGVGNSVCPDMSKVLTRAQLSAARQEAAD